MLCIARENFCIEYSSYWLPVLDNPDLLHCSCCHCWTNDNAPCEPGSAAFLGANGRDSISFPGSSSMSLMLVTLVSVTSNAPKDENKEGEKKAEVGEASGSVVEIKEASALGSDNVDNEKTATRRNSYSPRTSMTTATPTQASMTTIYFTWHRSPRWVMKWPLTMVHVNPSPVHHVSIMVPKCPCFSSKEPMR